MKRLLLVLLFTVSSAAAAKHIELSETNSYTFRGAVSSRSVDDAIVAITRLHFALKDDSPIYLVLDTPGGSVTAGHYLIRHLKSIKRKIHTISIFSASMGFVIMQSLDNRYILKDSMLMAHPASTNCGGNKYQTKSCEYMLKKLDELLAKDCASRIGVPFKLWESIIRDEKWYVGDDAVHENAADEVVTISCTESLMKKSSKLKESNGLFSVEVSASSCPTMLSPL